MSEQTAHLVDRVLPHVPYRQWVLTLPWDLAQAVAYDAPLCSAVFSAFAAEHRAWARRRAAARGLSVADTGCVLEIQRFADGGRLYPHAHALVPDGVFVPSDAGMDFVGLGPPTPPDVEAIVERTEARIRRVLARRSRQDDLDEATQQLELLLSCSLSAATKVADPPTHKTTGRGRHKAPKPLCARSPGGLQLHAAVRVRAADRAGLEKLHP